MLADLPPSSCSTRLTVVAPAAATAMPARVEPVNDTMSMPGCAAMAAPATGPSPWTRLNTPAGTPASCSTSVNSVALSGANSDGLSTMVQPAVSAGMTFRKVRNMGQFQAAIRPHTPIGSCTSKVEPRKHSKAERSSTAMVSTAVTTPKATWGPCARVVGAPISSVSASAISGMRRW